MNNTIAIDVVQREDGKLKAILPEARIVTDLPQKKDVSQAPYDDMETSGYKWAPWGKNDRLPTEIRSKIEKVPMAGVAIYKLTAMMYGNGLAYYRNSDLESGNTNIQRAYEPKIEAWMKKNRLRNKWLIPQFVDYRYNMNTFSELILNTRQDMITGLYHHSSEFCRLDVQNERTFDIDKMLMSPKFGSFSEPREDEYKKIPLFRWYDEDNFLGKLKGYNFAYHSHLRTPGTTYYARPFWIGLFQKNGWIDASISVPKIVNAMMSNQIRLKYQILIPESYFHVRHLDWDSYTDEKRNAIIDDLINHINNNLGNTDNAYASICTVFKEDSVTGNAQGKVEISAIDDKVKKDSWVPSANAADAQIVQGLGLHPSQVGLSPEGGKMGAGSGSDQRESFNTGISLNTIDQEIVLEPLNFVAEFNSRVDPDWDVTFFIDHTTHTTTNKQESGLEPGETTLNIE